MKPRQWILLTTLVICLSVVVGAAALQEQPQADENWQTIVIGKDRLVSVEALSEMAEASAGANPMARVQPQATSGQTAQSATPPPRPSAALKSEVAIRQPIVSHKDPRHVFAAIAVDPIRNELVVGDENNFTIVVYDRTTDTPPTAAFSEPKRVIGGDNTFLEYLCGVYVDPASGDIYGINNDTLNWMTVWGREANGNLEPKRKLATPHTTVRMAVDEEEQEIFFTVQDDHAVSVFAKMAVDNEVPLRLIQGPDTQLADPHGIALDSNTGLIYVSNWGTVADRYYDEETTRDAYGQYPRYGKANWPTGRSANIPGSGRNGPASITVYRKDAQGNVAPVQVISGPNTLLNWPTDVAVHSERGEVFVANDTGHTVTVYSADADGNAAPIRVLQGPNSLIKNPVGVSLDLENDELWVANLGSHSATVYDITADGDATPKRVIRSGPADSSGPLFANVHTLAFDTRRGELLTAN
jgi:DNA-binding beta-propeller fold protein YncE